MAKVIFKILFCFSMVFLWAIGICLMKPETWYIAVPIILGSVVAFCCACVDGWLDDLMDFVEGKEKSLLD
jgi:hypothetical protein